MRPSKLFYEFGRSRDVKGAKNTECSAIALLWDAAEPRRVPVDDEKED